MCYRRVSLFKNDVLNTMSISISFDGCVTKEINTHNTRNEGFVCHKISESISILLFSVEISSERKSIYGLKIYRNAKKTKCFANFLARQLFTLLV